VNALVHSCAAAHGGDRQHAHLAASSRWELHQAQANLLVSPPSCLDGDGSAWLTQVGEHG